MSMTEGVEVHHVDPSTPPKMLQMITPEALFNYAEIYADHVRCLCKATGSYTLFTTSFRSDLNLAIIKLSNHFIIQTVGKEPVVVVLMLVSHMYKAIPEGSIYRVWGMEVLVKFAIKRGIPLAAFSELTEELI